MVRAMLVMPPAQKKRLVGRDAQPWAELLARLSQFLRRDIVPVVVPLLSELSRNADQMTDTQRSLVGHSARRMLAFGWSEAERPTELIRTSLEGVCRTYESDPLASSTLIRRSLEASHLASHGYQEMPCLVREVERLIPTAPEVIEDVYRALLTHKETSDESVPLGRSLIMPLTSNRRQDFNLAVHQLGRMFSRFAKSSPVHATGAVFAAVEAEIAPNPKVPLEEITGVKIQVRDVEARLADDLSHIWDYVGHFRHATHSRMLDEFEAMLVRLAKDPTQADVLRAVLDRVIKESRFAVVWRRVLRAATAEPNTFGMEVRSLVFSREMLTRDDTSEPAGEFLRAIFPLLAVSEREKVEKLILAIADRLEGDQKKWAERNRDRLLGCLAPDRLVTEGAKEHLATLISKGGAPPNDPPFRMGEMIREEYTERDRLREEGVKVDDEPNRLLIELGTKAGHFASQFMNEAPGKNAARGILTNLQSLREGLRCAATEADEKVLESAMRDLVGACAAIAKVDSLEDDSELSGFIRAVMLEASADGRDEPEPGAAQEFDERRVIYPTARRHAAGGLSRLARNPPFADDDVVGAIVRLSRDSEPSVRMEIGSKLGLLIEAAQETALEILVRLCREDESMAVVKAALVGGQGLLASHPDLASPLIREVFDRANTGKGEMAGEVRKVCLGLSLAQNWRTDNPYGGPISKLVLDDLIANEDLAIELIFIASEHLLDGPIEPPDPRHETVRLRSIELLAHIAKQLAGEFQALATSWTNNGEWSEGERGRAEIVQKVAYQLGIRIQFAMEAVWGDHTESGGLTGRVTGARFLREAASLLDALLTISLANVVHVVLEILQQLMECDPGPVLLRILTAVRSGQKGAYQFESLGLDLIVKLVRRYLADHRLLLQADRAYRDAIVEILDVFVRVGWPAAMELTFRLDEIFR
jgi:hypothetical protein